MHNVDTEALARTAELARADPAAVRQSVNLTGTWQTETGAPQFRGSIPYPAGDVEFACDFPAAMGGHGAAPGPLAYCFWGGLACYAMTFALEAARAGVELKALRGTVRADVDQTRALGLSDAPPVEEISWTLEVEADAPEEQLAALKEQADARCPGVYCIRNPIDLRTEVR